MSRIRKELESRIYAEILSRLPPREKIEDRIDFVSAGRYLLPLWFGKRGLSCLACNSLDENVHILPVCGETVELLFRNMVASLCCEIVQHQTGDLNKLYRSIEYLVYL